MSARRCPPVGSPLLTLALAGTAYALCFAASLALRVFYRLRPDPAPTGRAPQSPTARCLYCGCEVTDAEFFSNHDRDFGHCCDSCLPERRDEVAERRDDGDDRDDLDDEDEVPW